MARDRTQEALASAFASTIIAAPKRGPSAKEISSLSFMFASIAIAVRQFDCEGGTLTGDRRGHSFAPMRARQVFDDR